MATINKKVPTKTYQRAFKNSNESVSISTSSEVTIEFESLCRLCLQKTDCMSEIFKDDCTVPIDVKIRTLLALRVEEDDDLPSLICGPCLMALNEFYEFKKRCIASDVRLRQLLLKVPPKHRTPDFDQSAHEFTLLEDISNQQQKKNDCTLRWDDNVPLASTIAEYGNAQRQLTNYYEKSGIDEENTTENHDEDNITLMHDEEDLPLALRLAIIEENDFKSRKLKNMKFSRVKRCQCSKMTAGCKTLKNHCVLKYKCGDCSKSFRTMSLLRRHFTVHTKQRPYVCYICDHTYPLKDTLRRHIMEIHSSVRPFKCDYCSKTFSLLYLLNAHVKRSHVLNQKFRCSHCPKVFTHASGLSRHKHTHNGTMYGCKICYKKFKDASSIKRHSKAVHCITW